MANLIESLRYDNPRREEYDRLISLEEAGSTTDSPFGFTAGWERIIMGNGSFKHAQKETQEYFRKKLANKILIDLGCGSDMDFSWYDVMADIAKSMGVATYIGIDKHIERSDEDNLYRNLVRGNETKRFSPMRVILLKGDMLDLVSKLENDTANFTINGINSEVLTNPDEYSIALAREIKRTLEPNGIVFGCNSDVERYLKREGLRRIDFPGLTKGSGKLDDWVYEKR